MRDWMNRYGVVLLIAAAFLVGLVLWTYGRGSGRPREDAVKAFYIDEESGEESVRPVTDVPPLDGKGGKPTIVVAVKYSCDGGKTSKVGYLRKYTAEGKAAMDALYRAGEKAGPVNINVREHTLVRLPESGSPWVAVQSPAGYRVTEAGDCPEGQRKTTVLPE